MGEGVNYKEKCEKLTRQLGGVNASNNRKSDKIRRLEAEVAKKDEHIDKLKALNGKLCEEINLKDKRIMELTRELEAANG